MISNTNNITNITSIIWNHDTYYNFTTYKTFVIKKKLLFGLFFNCWNLKKKKQFKQPLQRYYIYLAPRYYQAKVLTHIEFYVNSPLQNIILNKNLLKVWFGLNFSLNIYKNYIIYFYNLLYYSSINFLKKPGGLYFKLKKTKKIKLLNKNYKLL